MGNVGSRSQAAGEYLRCKNKNYCRRQKTAEIDRERRRFVTEQIRTSTSVPDLVSSVYYSSGRENERRKMDHLEKKYRNNLPGLQKEIMREVVRDEHEELAKLQRTRARCAHALTVRGLFPATCPDTSSLVKVTKRQYQKNPYYEDDFFLKKFGSKRLYAAGNVYNAEKIRAGLKKSFPLG